MQSVSFVFLLLTGVCFSLGNPSNNEESALILRQQQLEILSNTRLLIEQLVQNLQKTAKDAIEAVSIFRDGLIEQIKALREKIMADISKLRDRVQQALQDIYDRFSNSGQAVRECIESHRGQAETLFNDTAKESMACADDRIKEIGDQMDVLTNLANNASEFATNVMDEMRQCLEINPTDMAAAGRCLSAIAMRVELRGAMFITQSGLRIARLNLALATLPAALEICAGTKIVQAGVSTAKIVMGIGRCSASNIFSSLTGSNFNQYY